MNTDTNTTINSLVIDLGSGSSRVMLAKLHEGKLNLEEIYRFTTPTWHDGVGLRWNFTELITQIDLSLSLAGEVSNKIDSIGVDSWGLDYLLIDIQGNPAQDPFHYRHPRSQIGYEKSLIADDELFFNSGAQVLAFNTIYQLSTEDLLEINAWSENYFLLFIADSINHHLTSKMRVNYTLARTSGLIDPRHRNWNNELLQKAQIPETLFPPIIDPGEQYGILNTHCANCLGQKSVPVISVAGHDTASAVAATPTKSGEALIIAGSWFLVGIESEITEPSVNTYISGYGYEGGVEDTSYLIRSIHGLYFIQKIKFDLFEHYNIHISFPELSKLASNLLPNISVPTLDLNKLGLQTDSNIIAELADYLELPAHDSTESHAALLTAVIYKSISIEVNHAINKLEEITERPIEKLWITGGGSQDTTLIESISSESQREIQPGFVEASAWGNAIMQMKGLGVINHLEEGRELIFS